MQTKLLNKKILEIALPNIVSNISIPLLGLVDLAMVGHLNSPHYIGAIALGTMIFNLIYWTFAFLRMGSSGITAQAFGSRNFKEVVATLARGLLVASGASVLILSLQVPIEKIAFFLVKGSVEVEQAATSYFYIRIWAAPATIALYALSGWFIGMQNSKIPMTITLAINILNIAFNALFIYVLKFNSDGVAWGTLIAQYCGLIVALLYLRIYYKRYFKYLSISSVINLKGIKQFFQVNRDILIRTLSLLAVFTFFTSKSASTNDNILAANSLLLQFMLLFSFLTDGFAYAAEALVGKFYGARNKNLLLRSIKLIFWWGALLTVIFTLLFIFANKIILQLLTNQIDVIKSALQYSFWIFLIPITSVASFIWDGIFIGLTASKQMRNSMLIAVFVIFFPIYFLLYQQWGNHALWFAFIAFLFTRGFVQTLMFRKLRIKLGI